MASIPVWPRDTVDTPPVLIAIVGLLVSLSIALAAPLACWSRERARRRKFEEQFGKLHAKNTNGIPTHGYPSHGQDESLRENDQDLFDTQFGLPQQHPAFALSNSQHNHAQQQQQQHSHSQKPAKALDERASANIADLSIFHNEHLAAMKQMATERRMGKLLQPTSYSFPQTLKERNTDLLNSDKRSVVQSVATTSRLHSPANSKKKPFRSRMPWSHGRPIPRTETVQRSALMERQSQASEEGSQSHQSRSKNSLVPGQPLPGRGRPVSDAAGVFLDRHGIEGEADYYRQKYLSQRGGGSNNRVFSKRGRGRPPSLGGGSDVGSLMPSLNPDALTPQDAADANDPGRIPNPIQYGSYTHTTTSETMSHSRDISGILSAQFLNILDVAEPDFQYRRLLTLALPTTITAMADPLYRIVLVAIISHFCNDGENSMVAYLLVILFIRLTTEGISVAITDAESNMVQDVLLENGGGEIGFFKVGQTMQLAIFFQVVIGAPVLIMWFFIMENVVRGLVNNDEIAVIASNYTGVIIIDYIVRAMSRSFMLPFHLNGQGQFERNVDIGATIVTGAAITIVATTNDLSLTAIGWIQVIIGIAKAITKVAYVYFRGWFSPYRTGLLRFLACRVRQSVVRCLQHNLGCTHIWFSFSKRHLWLTFYYKHFLCFLDLSWNWASGTYWYCSLVT